MVNNTTKKYNMILYLCILLRETSALGPKLLIDHDGGADDAMAIFMALLNEKYFNGPNVVAITTVHGNVDEPQVFENTQRILNIAGRRDIPIYRGAKTALVEDVPTDNYFGHDGLGDNETTVYPLIEAKPEIAANALINLSKKYLDSLTVITLGSLTNMALAIKLDPEFLSRISQTYIAASYIYTKGLNKIEFNIKMDVEAYDIVIESGLADKITLIPSTQIKKYLNLGRKWRRETFGSINTEIVRSLNIFERISMANSESWNPLDPSAMALVLDPSLAVETRFTNNHVYLCGSLRGRTTNDFKSKSPNARLIFSVNKSAYRIFLYKTFSANAMNPINHNNNISTPNDNADGYVKLSRNDSLEKNDVV